MTTTELSKDDLRILAMPIDSREAFDEFFALLDRIDKGLPHRLWRRVSDEAWLCVAQHRNIRRHRGLELEDYVESLRPEAVE